MPVLHYTPVIGGLETWTKETSCRLTPKADVFVVTGKVKGTLIRDQIDGVEVFRTGLFNLKNLSYSSPLYILTTLPFLFFKSKKIIKKENINLLHCQGFLSSLLGYWLNKFTKTNYIITVQRLEKNTFLRRMVYKKARACIGASSAIANYFKEIGVDKSKIHIIPNGINLSGFKNLDRTESRKMLGLRDEFVVMTVARLEKVKGLTYLLKAFSELDKGSPCQMTRAALVIIGEGSERQNLEKYAEKLGISDRVRFIGEVPNQEIPKYLKAADCFCLPSIKEGFGIVILEAMATGIPVIASQVGGIVDIIQHEKNGLLVPAKASYAISRAILEIQQNPTLAQTITQSAQKTLKNYNWNNITEQLYKVYERI